MLHETDKNPNVKVIKDGDVYSIHHADGQHGSKEIAQKHIDATPYLHHTDVKEHEAGHWNKK